MVDFLSPGDSQCTIFRKILRTLSPMTDRVVGSILDITRGGSPQTLAVSQFNALVANAALGPGVNAGYARGGQRSTANPLDVLAGWVTLGDWDVGWCQIVVATNAEGALAMIDADSRAAEIAIDVFSPAGATDAQALLASLVARCPITEPPEEGLSVTFWSNSQFGPVPRVRLLEAQEWDEVEENYPTAVRSDLASMATWASPPSGGRLILAHGPPGSGKSTLLRSLVRTWRAWCSAHYIVDPDEFFGDSSYLLSVLLGGEERVTLNEDGSSPVPPWRLVVVEDCDEYLTANAKERTGQQVARLLNVADGWVGQGLRVMVVLTTNETVDNFHEAIVRPGRCLRNLYVGTFEGDEADVWRKTHDVAPTGEPASLAQLYAEQRGVASQRASRVAEELRNCTHTV